MSMIVGWCKLKTETEKVMKIAYSLEDNQICDGEIIFNKESYEMKINDLSKGASEILTKIFMGSLRHRIHKGMEQGKKYMIAS